MPDPNEIVIGVDTHADTHTAVVLSHLGARLAVEQFAADHDGYHRLLAWALSHGPIASAGVEGTSDYGAGLCAVLRAADIAVVEVNRPNRARRRRLGKSDPVDAENAARAVLAGDATATAKDHGTVIDSIRVQRVARSGAIKARTAAANQLKDLIVTAPDELRAELRNRTTRQRVRLASTWSPSTTTDPLDAAQFALGSIARRWVQLDQEVRDLDRNLAKLVAIAAPRLLAQPGVGPDSAGQLLITAGANPHRLHNEAAFAALCGVTPVQASSGKNIRWRLNRGGDRQANRALWSIYFTRLRTDERTKTYANKQTNKNTREISRNLKRYIARELYPILLEDIAALQQPAP